MPCSFSQSVRPRAQVPDQHIDDIVRRFGVQRAEHVDNVEVEPLHVLIQVRASARTQGCVRATCASAVLIASECAARPQIPTAEQKLIALITSKFDALRVRQSLPPRRHARTVRLGGGDAPYNHITFHREPVFDEKHLTAKHDTRVKLAKFDHTPGAAVYEGLFPHFEMPNGEQCYFYHHSGITVVSSCRD